MATSAVITGGIGPWLPFQMLALAGWAPAPASSEQVDGQAPPSRCVEVAALAAYGWVWGFLFGAIMNLWFWPFSVGEGDLSWSPGHRPRRDLERYWSFYAVTSFGWDAAGRARQRRPHPPHRAGPATLPAALRCPTSPGRAR